MMQQAKTGLNTLSETRQGKERKLTNLSTGELILCIIINMFMGIIALVYPPNHVLSSVFGYWGHNQDDLNVEVNFH